VLPRLTPLTEDAPLRAHRWRKVLHGLRRMVRVGAAWRLMPHDLPPDLPSTHNVCSWLKAGAGEATAHDLRLVLRLGYGRTGEPSAIIIVDSRTERPDS
jgi:transposase